MSSVVHMYNFYELSWYMSSLLVMLSSAALLSHERRVIIPPYGPDKFNNLVRGRNKRRNSVGTISR
jgi:hypothetical protein